MIEQASLIVEPEQERADLACASSRSGTPDDAVGGAALLTLIIARLPGA